MEVHVFIKRHSAFLRKCAFLMLEKPAKSGDHLNLDWVPNQNLGRFSKNWKLIENHFKKKKKTVPAEAYHRKEVNENGQKPKRNAVVAIASNDVDVSSNSVCNSFHTVSNKDFDSKSDIIADTPSVNPQIKSAASLANTSSVNTQIESAASLANTSSVNTQIEPANILTGKFSVSISKINRSSEETNCGSDQTTVTTKIQTVCPKRPNALNTILTPVKKRIGIINIETFLPKSIQTELSFEDIDHLFQLYQQAVEERDGLLMKIATMVIDFDYFKGNNKKTRFYTGLPTWSLLNNFYDMIKKFLPEHFNCKLSRFQMLVLTLMKLRLNLSFTDLGYRFRIDETTASRYFHRCIFILFKLFEKSKLVHWPDKRENLLLNTPSYFRATFKECITIIVDCFEIFSEKSGILRAAAQGFSNYKHHYTLKYLIGISVTGVILFDWIWRSGKRQRNRLQKWFFEQNSRK